MILELLAPGRQETRKTGESSAEEAGSAGEACEGCRRRRAQGLGGQPGRGAAAGAQGCRHGQGAAAVRSGERLGEWVVAPRRRLRVLPLGTRALAAGRRETVWWSTALAGLKAVAGGTGATGAASRQGFEVCQRQGGGAGEGLGALGVADGRESGQAGNPGRTAWRRWTASSWPLGGRWRDSMVVARRAWPLELCMARSWTPAARRGVAEPWRKVGMPPARCRRPARWGAVRQAPWTLRRCRGAGAVVRGV